MSYRLVSNFVLFIAILFLSISAEAKDWVYTIRPGDTLWNISKKHLKSPTYWQKLRQYNSVNLPKQLSPGIKVRIPIAWLKYPPETVKVTFVNGDVQVFRDNGQTAILKANDELQIGDTIRSRKGSAGLQFADGSSLLVQSQTELIFDSLSAYKHSGMVDTRLRLQRGRIETNVIRFRKPGSRFEITTPAAVAAVRGTRYRVNADGNENLMRAEVLEGNVDVANTSANQLVAANFGTLTELGQPPKPPRKLLLPPEFGPIPAKLRKMPATISWDRLKNAKKYRVQINVDNSKQELVYDSTVSKEMVTLSGILDGSYKLSVRGIDELGLEGINAQVKFVIDTHLEPPLEIPSIQKPTIDDNSIIFNWNSIKLAKSYHIQIATDSNFSKILYDETISGNSYTLKMDQTTDDYYFRILATAELHKRGKFSKPVLIAKPVKESGPKYDEILYFLGTIILIILIGI